MHATALHPPTDDDVYSASEIARAAGVPLSRVLGLVEGGHAVAHGQFVDRREAVRLVRILSGVALLPGVSRAPLTVLPETRRRQGLPLAFSGVLHLAFLVTLILITSGLFQSRETEQLIRDPQP